MAQQRILVSPVGVGQASRVAPEITGVSSGVRTAEALNAFIGNAPMDIAKTKVITDKFRDEKYEREITEQASSDPVKYFESIEQTPEGWSKRKWDAFNRLKATNDVTVFRNDLVKAKQKVLERNAESGEAFNVSQVEAEYQGLLDSYVAKGNNNPTYLKHFMPSASNLASASINNELQQDVARTTEKLAVDSQEALIGTINNLVALNAPSGEIAKQAREQLTQLRSDFKALGIVDRGETALQVFKSLGANGQVDAMSELLFKKDANGNRALNDTAIAPQLRAELSRAIKAKESASQPSLQQLQSNYSTTIGSLNEMAKAAEAGGTAEITALQDAGIQAVKTHKETQMFYSAMGGDGDRLWTDMNTSYEAYASGNVLFRPTSNPTIRREINVKLAKGLLTGKDLADNIENLSEKDYGTYQKAITSGNGRYDFLKTVESNLNQMFRIPDNGIFTDLESITGSEAVNNRNEVFLLIQSNMEYTDKLLEEGASYQEVLKEIMTENKIDLITFKSQEDATERTPTVTPKHNADAFKR